MSHQAGSPREGRLPSTFVNAPPLFAIEVLEPNLVMTGPPGELPLLLP